MLLQKASENSVDVLPLLCCLVGAVAFVCFGISATRIADPDSLEPSELQTWEHWVQQAKEEIVRLSDSLQFLNQANHGLNQQVDRKEEKLTLFQQDNLAGTSDYGQEMERIRERLSKERQEILELQGKLSESECVDVASAYNGAGGELGRPQFVECVKDTVLLQPQGRAIPSSEISAASHEFLDGIGSTGYVVFCVRPNGFESFVKARSIAEENEIAIGYEPINENWTLRF